ncbi:PLP-dependent transferase [Exidia glandulosa HHB12029]|uniref:PLP-dependent transferase n=1 Tax=Exidia glandulosa HHB12029 TaxID=1314781 RepID=A0A165ZNB1_EXIGL|nr:PLP-dependent transferase [Exidia glandulosa HHB12029]
MSAKVTANGSPVVVQEPLEPSAMLHRTPWRPPVAVSGQGIYVTLKDGRKIIDGAGGAAVTSIGNGHPEVVKAIQQQVGKLAYVYSMQMSNEPAEELAKTIIESSNGAFELVGYLSGGSEAMEAVIKMGRQYFLEVGQPQRTRYIARHLSYHGNTMGTLGLCDHPARKDAYMALLPSKEQNVYSYVSPAYYARFKKEGETEEQYVQRLKEELDAKFQEVGPETVIGFVAETVVGATTGAVPPPKGYFKAMKEVCDKYGALFILDEVMSGMGRMGTMHAWESFGDGVSPDLQAVAKGLGGGYVSIGAILMSPRIAAGLRGGSNFWKHGHTYQSHPIACAGALAVQHVIKNENLLDNCRKMGELLESQLRSRLTGPNATSAPYVFDIRGGGLFWGIEFELGPLQEKMHKKFGPKVSFAALLSARCFDNGLVIMGFNGGANIEGTKGEHILLAPAYNVTKDEVAAIVDIVVKSTEDLIDEISKA